MFKTNKKSIIYSLGTLAIFTTALFGVALMPTPTKADYNYFATSDFPGGYASPSSPTYRPAPTPTYTYPSYYPTPTYYYQTPPVYVQPEPVYVAPVSTTSTIYSDSTNPNPKTTPVVAKAKTTTSKPSAVAYIAVPAGTKVVNSLPAGANVSNGATSDQLTGLTANAIFGSNGFMPNGIIQWILLAIMILVVIILVRKISGADKNYHAAPLKHD